MTPREKERAHLEQLESAAFARGLEYGASSTSSVLERVVRQFVAHRLLDERRRYGQPELAPLSDYYRDLDIIGDEYHGAELAADAPDYEERQMEAARLRLERDDLLRRRIEDSRQRLAATMEQDDEGEDAQLAAEARREGGAA